MVVGFAACQRSDDTESQLDPIIAAKDGGLTSVEEHVALDPRQPHEAIVDIHLRPRPIHADVILEDVVAGHALEEAADLLSPHACAEADSRERKLRDRASYGYERIKASS